MTERSKDKRWILVALALLLATSVGLTSALARTNGETARQRPSVRVAPNGNDSSCARGALARPCATFNRAYQLARPGDVVEVMGGTYPTQTLVYDAGKRAPNVVLREARGQVAHVKGTVHIGNNRGNRAPAQFVTFERIDMDQAYLHYEGGPRPRDITFRSLHLGTKQETGLYSGSSQNLRLVNVEFGPTCCDEDGAQIAQGGDDDPQPTGTLLEGVRFHDIRNSCDDIPRAVWPNCRSESKPYDGNHVDCLQSTGGDNWTFRRAQFVNCQTGVQLGAEKGVYWNMTVENSYFEGFHPFKITCGGPCSSYYAFRARTPAGRPSFLRVYYNTMASGISVRDVEPGTQAELVGNLVRGPSNNGGRCNIEGTDGKRDGSFTKAMHNMFSSGASACGPTNTNGQAAFVNTDERAGPIDLRLRRGSAGIGRGHADLHPRTDIEGKLRPLRWRPDVGAWQHESAAVTFSRSVGAIRLGMSRAAVSSTYGNAVSTEGSSSTYRRAGGRVVVTFDARDRVAAVRTTSSYFTTRTGMGVGGNAKNLPRQASWFSCRRAFQLRRRGAVTEFGAAGRGAETIRWIGVARGPQARC